MSKGSLFIWISLSLLLLLPATTGRFLIDLAGGLIIFVLILPIIIAGAGWIGWRVLKSKMVKCEVCGISTFNNSSQCPVCGSSISNQGSSIDNNARENPSIPASSATIDITAEDVDINHKAGQTKANPD